MISFRQLGSVLIPVLLGSAPALAGFSVDESTGDTHYSYDFNLPPGRGKYQPRLSLQYGSGGVADVGYGSGWTLSGEWIEVTQPPGSGLQYVHVKDGMRRVLVAGRDNYFMDEYETANDPHLSFASGCGMASADDAAGNTYVYTGGDPSTCEGILYLQSVTDAAGNVTSFAYDPITVPFPVIGNASGLDPRAVLSHIRYNYYDPNGTARQHAWDDPYATTVDLSYFVSAGDSTHPAAVHLSNVAVNNVTSSGAVAPIRNYRVAIGNTSIYNNYPEFPVYFSILSLTQVGSDGTAAPPASFEYGNGQSLLWHITEPMGAHYALTFGKNGDNGDAVGSVTISGPGMETSQVKYFYDSWVPTVDGWFPQWIPAANAYRTWKEVSGYGHSYAYDVAAGTVRMTMWETSSHLFHGVPRQIDSGPVVDGAAVPPTFTLYKRDLMEHSAILLPQHSLGIPPGTCVPPDAPPTQSVAGAAPDPKVVMGGNQFAVSPAVTFVSRARSATFMTAGGGQQEFANESTVQCSAVDLFGNVRQRHVDPQVVPARSGDDHWENTTFVAGVAGSSSCKSCVLTQIASADEQGTAILSSTRYVYDSASHVAEVWKTTDPGIELRFASYVYNPNGNVAASVEAPDEEHVTTTYSYDTYQVHVSRLQTSQGTKTLTTDTSYDTRGYPVLEVGPYLGDPSTGTQRGTAYDGLGRVTSITRAPLAPTGGNNPATVEATRYIDFNPSAPSSPASLVRHRFAVPTAYGGWETGPSTTSYLDGLGRIIQIREQLGPASDADPSGHILGGVIGNYRVSALLYDAAGRLRAEVEPFYSSFGAFRDYRTATVDDIDPASVPAGMSTAIHARLHAYDAQGRETCSVVSAVPSGGAVPLAAPACRSSFAETSGYARATATCYRVATEKVPPMMAVKTVPPELTAQGAPTCDASTRGPETFVDASGRTYETHDVDGNQVQYSFDLLGNQTAIVRTSADSAASIATTATWDMVGRIKHRTDPNIGTQDFTYYTPARPKREAFAAHALTGGTMASDYVEFAYDLGRLSSRNGCTAVSGSGGINWNCSQDTYTYDAPSDEVPGSHLFTAGRLSSAKNATGVIAFGYDDGGALVARDEIIYGLSGVFSVDRSILSTGQAFTTAFSSAYSSSVSYDTFYDTMLRPEEVTSGGVTLWNAAGGGVGSYDALGRIPTLTTDSGAVRVAHTFLPYSGLDSSSDVSFTGGSAPHLYQISQETYLGTRLLSFRDETIAAQTTYWYTDGGKLKAAKVVPDSASAARSTTCFSFNRNKMFTPGAGFGNLERVREQQFVDPTNPSSVTMDTYNYTGTDIASVGPGPDAPASLERQAQTANVLEYDYAGRIVSKSDGSEVLTYDVLGRLLTVTRANDVGEMLTYDALGQVVGRLSGAVLTYYVGSDATVTAAKPADCTAPGCSLGGTPAVVDIHVGTGGRRLATIRALSSGPGRVLYYYRDRLGSVVATSTTGGNEGARYGYDAYGSVVTASNDVGDIASELGFAGMLRLSKGLVVMGARVYDSNLRQFLTPDTLDPMSYTYAAGDPVNFIDPTGRAPQRARDGAVGDDDGGGVTTTPSPSPGGGLPIWIDPGTLVNGAEWLGGKIADAAGAAWGALKGLFGGGGNDAPPPPRPPPHWRSPAGNWTPRVLPPGMLVPPGANVDDNMAAAANHGHWWFYKRVKAGGDWDYTFTVNPMYSDFTQFNYGAAGTANGLSSETLRRAAGFYQQYFGRAEDGAGSPFGDAPFGDDPRDEFYIRLGVAYANCIAVQGSTCQ